MTTDRPATCICRSITPMRAGSKVSQTICRHCVATATGTVNGNASHQPLMNTMSPVGVSLAAGSKGRGLHTGTVDMSTSLQDAADYRSVRSGLAAAQILIATSPGRPNSARRHELCARRALVGYVDLAGFGRGPQLTEVVEGLIGVGVGPVDDCLAHRRVVSDVSVQHRGVHALCVSRASTGHTPRRIH